MRNSRIVPTMHYRNFACRAPTLVVHPPCVESVPKINRPLNQLNLMICKKVRSEEERFRPPRVRDYGSTDVFPAKRETRKQQNCATPNWHRCCHFKLLKPTICKKCIVQRRAEIPFASSPWLKLNWRLIVRFKSEKRKQHGATPNWRCCCHFRHTKPRLLLFLWLSFNMRITSEAWLACSLRKTTCGSR